MWYGWTMCFLVSNRKMWTQFVYQVRQNYNAAWHKLRISFESHRLECARPETSSNNNNSTQPWIVNSNRSRGPPLWKVCACILNLWPSSWEYDAQWIVTHIGYHFASAWLLWLVMRNQRHGPWEIFEGFPMVQKVNRLQRNMIPMMSREAWSTPRAKKMPNN